MLVYFYCRKNIRTRWNIFGLAIAWICISMYIIAYVYLLFSGKLNWIKGLVLLSVICFAVLSVAIPKSKDSEH